jgi:hypothetical protein
MCQSRRKSLDHDGPGADPAATEEIADPDLYDVTAAQFAVDRQIEHRPIPDPALTVEPEADGSDLLGFEGALRANLSASVPWLTVPEAWIVLGMSRCLSPAG